MRLPLPEKEWLPKPTEGCDAPAFWVRRLVFIDDISTSVKPYQMDRTFHRGLNIVWADESNGGGHGAGKTTLCQFVRYCMGEPSYGPERFTKALAAEFPSGFVGAEIMVGDTVWAVLRPIDLTNKELKARCLKDSTIEELIQAEESLEFSEFHHAFRECLLSRCSALPEGRRDRNDLAEKLLAWLSRDQEARYAGLHQWRKADAGSGVSNPANKDAGHAVMRQVLGLFSEHEIAACENLRSAEKNLRDAKSGLKSVKEREERLLSLLAFAFDVPKEKLRSEDSLIETGGETFLRNRYEEAKAKQDAVQDDPELQRLLNEERESDKKISNIEGRVQPLEEDLNEKKNAVDKYQSIIEDKIKEKNAVDLGLFCSDCNHTVAAVLEKFGELPADDDGKVNELEAQKEAAKRKKKTVEEEMRRLAMRVDTARLGLPELQARLDKVRDEINTKRRQVNEERNKLSRKAARCKMDLDSWGDLERVRKKVAKATEKEQESERKKRAAEDAMKNGFVAVEETKRKLDQDFKRLVRNILKEPYDGTVTISKYGELQPRLRRRKEEVSTALDALKVIVFDLAALLTGIEGAGGHPGFIIHDSPREADLMLDFYHGIFREMKRWAEGFEADEAPFQYIITTTTPPPEEMRNETWVCWPPLDASKPESRLLGIDIGNAGNNNDAD